MAELQSGHATTIRVSAEGRSFGVADDGRGHAVDRSVAGVPYLDFVYTHLDYPFESAVDAPVQLHCIGVSLLNTLCSELSVTVRKPDKALRLWFRDGQLDQSELKASEAMETGTEISGTIHPRIQAGDVDLVRLEEWLVSLLVASPSLKIIFNGVELQAARR